jgi:hypothetical protein
LSALVTITSQISLYFAMSWFELTTIAGRRFSVSRSE